MSKKTSKKKDEEAPTKVPDETKKEVPKAPKKGPEETPEEPVTAESNDAAETMSYFLGRTRTIELMNEKAKSIFMGKSQFACPSGYDPGNVSTAQDLFYLIRYIYFNRPPLLEITRSKMVSSFGPVSFDVVNLWNKNIFVNDPTFVGGKTGFIKASRYTSIFAFRLIFLLSSFFLQSL